MFDEYFWAISTAVNTLNQGDILAMAALFLVLALGELGVPFPFVLQSALFLIGYQMSQGAVQVLPLVIVLVLGRQVGSAFVYWMGRSSANPVISWIEKRFRPMRTDLEKLKMRLQSKAPLVIAASRLTPGLLVPTSLASGAMSLRYDYFVVGIILSEIVWDGSFIISGALLGFGIELLDLSVSRWFILPGLMLVSMLGWFFCRYMSRRKTP
jgi:membrane protein DedA with SNARE-associated domain